MRSGDKIFHAVVLAGLGLAATTAEIVSCGGGNMPHEGPPINDAGIGSDGSSSDASADAVLQDDGSSESGPSDGSTGGKDGFPMEGPPM